MIVYPPTLPQHARCPHIQANGKCGGSCYGHYAGTGPLKCSNLYCLGHPSLGSSACYTQHCLQPRQRLPLSVFDDLEAVYLSRREGYIADQSRTSGLAEDPEDDNRGPFVFRRAPRPPVVDYDNDRDNLFETVDEGLHAGLVDAPQSRPTMQETSGKRALRRIYAALRRARLADDHGKPANFVSSRIFLAFIRELNNHGNGPLTDSQNSRVEDLIETIFDELAQIDHRDIHAESTAKVARIHSEAKPTPAEEADMLVKDIVNLIRQERAMERSDEQDPKPQEKKAFTAQNRSGAKPTPAEEAEHMVEAVKDIVRQGRVSKQKRAQEVKAFIVRKAAGFFAKEERELKEKEDFYKLRGPSEDPLPPLASSMEDLMERDAQIEARIRRVTAHEYRNSLVTSTTTPNVDNPSKSSLDNPIIDIAIDQFLTQDPEKLETLHQKLGKLCGIALERADKLGLEGTTKDDSYLLKHICASKHTRAETFWSDDSEDDESTASFFDKEPLSKAEGKRPVECADAASARCQHHSCQPIRTQSRLSSTFSDTTSYGPFLKNSEAPAEDAVKPEKLSRKQFPFFGPPGAKTSLTQCVAGNSLFNENIMGPLLEPLDERVMIQ